MISSKLAHYILKTNVEKLVIQRKIILKSQFKKDNLNIEYPFINNLFLNYFIYRRGLFIFTNSRPLC